MMKNTFVLQVITSLEILDTTQIVKETCPESVCFVRKEKLAKKLLMWIAVSDCGMSEPLFHTSTAVAINTSTYINECLEK